MEHTKLYTVNEILSEPMWDKQKLVYWVKFNYIADGRLHIDYECFNDVEDAKKFNTGDLI